MALANYKWDNEACSKNKKTIQKTNYTEEQLRSLAETDLVNHYGFRKIIIDGLEVEGLPTAEPPCSSAYPENCQSPYRVQTPVFSYTVPALENILIKEDGACYNDPNNGQPYTVDGAVADGFYVMIKPLPLGKHTIEFGPIDAVTGKPTRLYSITVSEHAEQGYVEKSFH